MIRSHKNIYYSSMLLSYVRSSKQPRKATKKVFSQDDDDDEGHFGSGLTFVVDDKYQQQQFQICEWCAYGSFYSCYDARKHSGLMNDNFVKKWPTFVELFTINKIDTLKIFLWVPQ